MFARGSDDYKKSSSITWEQHDRADLALNLKRGTCKHTQTHTYTHAHANTHAKRTNNESSQQKKSRLVLHDIVLGVVYIGFNVRRGAHEATMKPP